VSEDNIIACLYRMLQSHLDNSPRSTSHSSYHDDSDFFYGYHLDVTLTTTVKEKIGTLD